MINDHAMRGHKMFSCIWERVTTIFYAFEGGGQEYIYHHPTFQSTPQPVIVDNSLIKA